MAKFKFKDENDDFISVVQDVKVNGTSAFDGEVADIRLKTINNQSILGSGNIVVGPTGVVDQTYDGTSTNAQSGVAIAGAGFLTSSALSGYQTTSNLVTSISSQSTDIQYPSAKCVYDIIGNIESLLAQV